MPVATGALAAHAPAAAHGLWEHWPLSPWRWLIAKKLGELLDRAHQLLLEAAFVVPHTDADGLAAGAIALRARGEGAEQAILLGRGQTPFGDAPPIPRGVAAVLDWGVRTVNRPALLVDHHAPEVTPGKDQLLVSGYGEEFVSTAVLMKRIVPDAPPPAWLVAVGAAGDYGDDGLKRPECAGAPKTAVRKLVPLINAPRRLKDGPVRVALQLLVEHDDPKAFLRDPRIEQLAAAKAQWRAAFDAAVRTAPIVNDTFALLYFSSDCQVHPLVATAWARRLSPRIVIAANANYIPGMINFAVRGGSGNADLRRVLREALPEARGEFAMGHDRATGGSLPPAQFHQLIEAVGLKLSGKLST
ncbi:MAG TPA: hypothetical protein VF669_05800 [Tepidisphaeraceae bacterium]|jgi:single-stranded-DNA-specific exonuclease